MKRKLFYAATAATLLFTGCANDEYVGEVENPRGELTEITFASKNAGITRAESSGSDAADLLGKNFVVVGYKNVGNDNKIVFDHYNVNYTNGTANSTLSNTAGWEYVGQDQGVRGVESNAKLAGSAVTAQTIKYWDYSATSYDFVAFSMGKGASSGEGEPQTTTYATPTAVKWNQLTTGAYTLSGDFNTLRECYISDKLNVQQTNYSSAVQLQFRHLTSKIRMALYETVPGYVVSEIKFYKDADTKPDTETTPTLYGNSAFNKEGTYTISFPSTTPKVSFKAATQNEQTKQGAVENNISFLNVSYKTFSESYKENAINSGSYLGTSSSTASYCGEGTEGKNFTVILPNEDQTSTLTLKIDYTLTSTDGSNETIKVTGATAVVPAQYAAWKPGYAYTYLFKISQNTNGSTGGSDDPTGLTAISFDAVVLADEVTGQETITTVSNPSITTIGVKDGKITMGGDEYETCTTIYATAHVPAQGTQGTEGYVEAKTAAPQKLYTVTLKKGSDTNAKDSPAQTINEASIKNALAATTNTVTDINGWELKVEYVTSGTEIVSSVPSEDGGTRSVNALKWDAENAGTIYAVEYETTTNDKVYKIVRIKSN